MKIEGIGSTYGVSRDIVAGVDILCGGCISAPALDAPHAERDRFDSQTPWKADSRRRIAKGPI